MPNWIDEEIDRQYRLALLDAVDRDRRAALVLAGRTPRTRLYTAALLKLGDWLVAWGSSLQLRYGAIVEPPAAVNARNHASQCS
jgi:hypothetical protein